MARVLVIDDDEAHRTLARGILEKGGHEVVEAKDGAEGLRLFGRHRPHVVMTDIAMPELDGHELISALRLVDKGVPIIAISGGGPVAKDDLLMKALSLGAVEVITKPFEFRQLVGAVERAIAR